MFVQLLKGGNLSKNILAALGRSPEESFESIEREERTLVWKLTDVEDITGFKDSK